MEPPGRSTYWDEVMAARELDAYFGRPAPLPPPPPPAPEVPFDHRPAERLRSAGLTASAHPLMYELACLLCGRGVGQQGVLVPTHRVPRRTYPCLYCGGFMLLREIGRGSLARLMSQAHTYHENRRVA